MKIVKIILLILISLVIAVALIWCVITYLAWPKPELMGLVPEKPLLYIAASDFEDNIWAAKESEFVERVARSPLWKDFKSSGQWDLLKRQWKAWEKQMQASINPKGIIQLVGKDAILAFYAEQKRLDFLLISEVSTITRINVKSGSTEKTLKEVYKFTEEKYKGAELITLAVPGLELSYGFIGRAGMLSTDVSLLRKCVDLHKGDEKGFVNTPEFRKLGESLSKSDISFHVNAAKIQDAADHPFVSPLADMLKSDPLFQYVDVLTLDGSNQNGNLMLDLRAIYNSSTQSMETYFSTSHPTELSDLTNLELPVPADCLFFALYEMLELDTLFNMVESAIGINLDYAEEKLTPALHNGAAIAALKPNIKELQLLPPMMVLFQVKNKSAVQNILEDIIGSISVRDKQLEFMETEYDGVTIRHARVPIVMGMSLDAGYTFIEDKLLVLATDTSALKTAIDVSRNSKASLIKDKSYVDVLAPIAESAEGRIFMDIASTAGITRQAGKLYAWRAKIAGEKKAEQISTLLYQNIFILEAWRYAGITFESEGDIVNAKMVLNSSRN